MEQLAGGFGSAVLEFMTDNNYSAHVERLGIPDSFVIQGKILNYIRNADMIQKE